MKILITLLGSAMLFQAGCATEEQMQQCDTGKCDSLDQNPPLELTVQVVDRKTNKCLTYVGAQPFAGRDFAWQDCRDEEIKIQSFLQESYASGERRLYQEHADQIVHVNFGDTERAFSFDSGTVDKRFVYWIYDTQTVFQEKFTERDPGLASALTLLPTTDGTALGMLARNPTAPEERNDWSVTCLASEGFTFRDPDTEREQIVTADISLSRGNPDDPCFDYNGNGVADCEAESTFADICADIEIRSLD